ncbi:MAG: DUF1573 domain-containing protein [Bacteroidaceae bacterium]|nr:DUF1573 domain-containing protein [Bacteroidaceae bacterium]
MVSDSLIVIGLATLSLGTIKEADGPREQTFCLRNAGQQAVALMQGYTSCGCTTIRFDRGKAVEPGDSTCVTLRFNPRGKSGEFEETGTLVYGFGHKTIQLSLTGTCISSEESLLQQFPIRISDNLRLSANRFDLGIMRVGETKERSVVVLHRDRGDRREIIPVRFTADAKTPKGLQHITRRVKTGGKTINITLDVLVR